jgi:DNA-binding NtrC family response regulator
MMIDKKAVFIVNADPKQSADISHLLEQAGCLAQAVGSMTELKDRLKDKACIAVIMDIDSVVVDNRTMKGLASAFPSVPLLCLSKERFHPELKDSICNHTYACLTKPIDPDELRYWLKCILEDDRDQTVG